MMFFNVLTLFTALGISAIAIYYSVVGLTTIFAASVVPVAIMGTALEISKLVTAVWLHKYWRKAVWWLKTYLSVAVVVLMFITSMGIFGFLSKSHIEQTAASDEQTAKIQTIDGVIARGEAKIERLQRDLARLNSGEADTRVDTLIEREQAEFVRLTNAVNTEKATLRVAAETAISNINAKTETARAAMEAELSNTFFGKDAVRKKFDEAQSQNNQEAQSIREKLEQDLAAVDAKYASNLSEVNTRLTKLKTQSEEKTGDIETRVADTEQQIEKLQGEIDEARENKAGLESAFRQLEAEVGPVKYIAEFIYGQEADRNLLEEAVRWVIVIIIFVFDPLAVLLLIASQYAFEMTPKRKPKKEESASGPDIDDVWNNVPVLPEVEEIKEEIISDPPKKKKVVRKKKKLVNKELTKEEKHEQMDPDPESAQTTEQTAEKEPKVVPSNKEKISPIKVNTEETSSIELRRVGPEYILYDGKRFRDNALSSSHPELHLDIKSKVDFGSKFPLKVNIGQLFLRSDFLPTKLYRYNGESWDPIDKGILLESAYSNNYIQQLIDKITSNEYDPQLLNNIEQQKIQQKITNDL